MKGWQPNGLGVTTRRAVGVRMNFKMLAMVAALAALPSCASAPALQPGPNLTLVDSSVLPPPEGIEAGGERPYRLGPFDRLSVNVFGVPELSQTVQIDAGGRLSLPLAGSLSAGGLTAQQLAAQIQDRLRTYVRDPQVTVNVEETVSQVVTVDGQVTQPGLYPVIGRMTLMRAIATARGTTEFARLQDVVVFRTVGNQDMAALYNLGAIRQGAYPDPEIFAHDVIVVGDSPARRRFRDILQASPLFLAPLVAVIQRF
jgi:polysaccharide export outer membrane protein